MPLAGEILTASVLSIGISAAPISTATNGTPSSGLTETFDIVLGYLSFTAINGHQYEVKLEGLIGNAGVAGDIYSINIRDSGSASNPTAGSTLVAQTSWVGVTAGTSGRQPIPLSGVWTAAGSGTHILGVSAMRTTGTGAFTPVSPPALARQLFVVDLGGN